MSNNITMAAVLLSVSGETKEVLRVAQQLKGRNCSLIAITCSDSIDVQLRTSEHHRCTATYV